MILNIKNRGFTLVEMLFAMAIMVVLSGAILVSIESQRKSARVTKVLAEVSANIQPIYMCVADGGSIVVPSGQGGGNICSGLLPATSNAKYGQWASLSGTDFNNYYDGVSPANIPASSDFDSDDWFIETISTGVAKVCCNSSMLGCKRIETSATCNATTPSS
jgi:prepilin-type N-terminal cleavage/methylation domain-containing protein